MYVSVGTETNLWYDIWLGEYACQDCGQISDFHLLKEKEIWSIFSIPIFFSTKRYLMVCNSCCACTEFEKSAYENLKNPQEVKLYNNQFPAHIVKMYYNPATLKIPLKRGLFLFAIISLVLTLGAIWPIALPMIISFNRANKKYKVYEEVIRNETSENHTLETSNFSDISTNSNNGKLSYEFKVSNASNVTGVWSDIAYCVDEVYNTVGLEYEIVVILPLSIKNTDVDKEHISRAEDIKQQNPLISEIRIEYDES